MIRAFADTSFYIASANPNDSLFQAALRSGDECAEFVTTEYVLVELGNYFCSTHRKLYVDMIELIEHDPTTLIVLASTLLRKQGTDLYASRPDKSWSLTDCISFVVMQQQGIVDALTGDHHFQQAGFNALLRQT